MSELSDLTKSASKTIVSLKFPAVLKRFRQKTSNGDKTETTILPKKNMPYVNIQITRGATRDQKAQLVKDATDSLVRVLGKRPDHIHVVIQEIAEEDWGYSGLLTDEWKRKQSE